MKLARAWCTLVWISFRRQLWSPNTLMVLIPLGACAAFLLRRDYAEIDDFGHAFDAFSQEFVIFLFSLFVAPICALAYATTSIGGDREDRTLLFLLVRPMPRALILLAKAAATTPLAMGIVTGSFFMFCRMAGPVGEAAFEAYLPAIFAMTFAYICLFHLFAVAFRHSTIIALVYALFMEFFLGNMPGIVKRVAVNFYGRSMVYDFGNSLLRSRSIDGRLDMPDPRWFVPVSGAAGLTALVGIAVGGLLIAIIIFELREYRDLT